MEIIPVEVDCEMERCGNCHLADTNHGAYDCYCHAFQIMLEPDEAERNEDGAVDIFFRCQKCLESTIK